MYTIKDLSEGKVAVKNDGTLEELREVLKMAFPNESSIPTGKNMFYSPDCISWIGTGSTDLPTQSVKDFLTTENNVCESIIDLIRNKVYTEPGGVQVLVRDEFFDAEKRQSIIDFLKEEDFRDFHVITKKNTTTIHVKY